MKAGSAWADVTPSQRLTIAGQMHVRYGEYTHDPLTVNAVAFEQDGTRVALVSCDLCLMSDDYTRDIQARCEKAYGLPASSVIIGCTHTHVAPLASTVLIGDLSPSFMEMLSQSIVKIVGQALDDIEEIELYADPVG